MNEPLNPGASAPAAGPTAAAVPNRGRERRREHRHPIQSRATLTVLDGPGAGSVFEVQTRDLSLSGICFLLRQTLNVGQMCRIDVDDHGRTSSRICEVVRWRPLSNGKFEMAAQFRREVGREAGNERRVSIDRRR